VLGTGSFAVELRNGVANGGGLLWVGFSKRYAFGLPLLPFDLTALGAPGCSVLAEQFATGFVVLDPQGVARMALPLPNDPALRYLTVFGQGAVFAAGANQLGALFSGGLAIRLQ
jgi:hypothetical protein